MSSTTDLPGRIQGSPWLVLVLILIPASAILVAVGGPALGIAATVSLLGVVAFFRMPGVLFAAYLLLPFYKGAVQGYLPIDLTVVLAILNSLQVVFLLTDARPRAVPRAAIFLWSALALLILGGVLYAPDQDLAISNAVYWLALLFLPILIGGLRVGSEPRYLRQLLWSFFAMGVLTTLLGFSQLSDAERLSILDTNTIQVARAALLVPLLGITFVAQRRGRLGILGLAVIIPASIVVAFASGSRGPVLFLGILLLVGVVLYLFGPGRVNWKSVAVIGLVVTAAAAVTLALAPDLPNASLDRFALLGGFVSDGLTGGVTTSAGDTSSATRVTLFSLAVSMFQERPLLGYGTGGFEALSPLRLPPMEAEAWPHNALLQMAADFGLVGLGIFAALLFLVVLRGRPGEGGGTALLFAFAFLLLNAMVSGDIFTDRQTWGLLMLILLVESPIAEQLGRNVPKAAAITPPRDVGSGARPVYADA